MAQDIEKKYGFNIKGELKRTVPRIFRYDAGPNVGTLRKKPKKTVKKKTRSGNIGNIDMEGFKSSNVIIGQADNIGKKMSPNKAKVKPKNKTYIVDGRKISALSRQDALKKAKKTKRTTNAAGQRMGQRKAGGVIKAGKGKIILDKLLEVTAPPLSKAGRTATAIKKITGRNKTKKSKEEINKMFDKVKDSSKNTKKTSTVSKIINKYPRTTVGAAVVTAAALKTKDKKRDKGKDKIVGKKRKEKKNISQSDIIGKGSKKGRMAGGMMKKYTKGGMNKYNKGSMLGDLDKDGVMSGYEQKRQDAITTAMGNKKMGGGMAKKKMMGGGMMQYSKGTGKKGVTVQARGCGLARKKPTKMS